LYPGGRAVGRLFELSRDELHRTLDGYVDDAFGFADPAVAVEAFELVRVQLLQRLVGLRVDLFLEFLLLGRKEERLQDHDDHEEEDRRNDADNR